MHNQRMIQSAFGSAEGMAGVSWLPHFHDMGLVGMVQQTIYAGTFAVLMSPLEFIRKPGRWLSAISKYRAYGSGAPNFAYDLCVERVTAEEMAGLDLSCWKRAFNGSEPVRAETLERFTEKFAPCGFRAESFLPCYGLAEATLFVAAREGFDLPVVRGVAPADLENGNFQEADQDGRGESKQLVGCGRGWGDERIMIVDPETFKPCPAERIGEIWLAGSHIADGYWKRAEQSRETFGARLAGTGEGPFLRTGDLGCIVGGELFVTGRLKDLIILRGKNHYPHDIEATVALSHPALRPNCGAAFSVDVDEQEELVVLQEVKSRTSGEQTAEIHAAIRQALAEEHAVKPHVVILLKPNTIPRTSSGKIRRSACRIEFLENCFAQKAFA
jgi:acyl-CoA synthetase (AMP-forming)/AMP-acid ligase II